MPKLQLEDAENSTKYIIDLNDEDFQRALTDNFYAQALLNHARVTAAEVQYSAEYDEEEHFETRAETETIADKNASNLVKTEVTTVTNLQKTVSSAASSADKELRSPWKRSEILKLIILYEENQESFKSTVIRKDRFWNMIADKMESDKNGEQCRNKFKYLKTMYTKKKDNMSANKTGESKIMFAYFDEMDEIFKKDHNIEPVAIALSSNNNFPSETTTHNDSDNDPPSKKNKTGGKNTKRSCKNSCREREKY